LNLARVPGRSPWYKLAGARTQKATPMATDDVTHHSVPEIVISRDGPEDRRVAFVDDYGGKVELSTQQLRNLVTLLVSVEFWMITGL
jgi:hypothetical protein